MSRDQTLEEIAVMIAKVRAERERMTQLLEDLRLELARLERAQLELQLADETLRSFGAMRAASAGRHGHDRQQ